MINKIGKYQFGAGNTKRDLCPFCLEELKQPVHIDCFPKGTVILKRRNYALIKVARDEPVIKRMLIISKNKKDDSKTFILLYVDKTLVGYKGEDKTRFIPGFSKEEYKQILKNYVPRCEKKKGPFEFLLESKAPLIKKSKINSSITFH